jgi:hypothetical protein
MTRDDVASCMENMRMSQTVERAGKNDMVSDAQVISRSSVSSDEKQTDSRISLAQKSSGLLPPMPHAKMANASQDRLNMLGVTPLSEPPL